mmetsp:Transcript_9888/g.32075  ORF Transcript_9888/g.32075 Transcript_9888/m.32075 type:complete len:150 (-) Transcript_9888:68-517(-)
MVRFKNRYLLLELVWKDGKVDDTLGGAQLLKIIRDSVQVNFGDDGMGSVAASMQVKYINPLTGLCVLRCGRESYREVWGAATLVTEVRGRVAALRVLHVGGTLRSCQAAALKHDLAALTALQRRAKKGKGERFDREAEAAKLKIESMEM